MRWPISKAWLDGRVPGGKKRREKKPKPEAGVRPENRRVFAMAYALCAILLVVDIYAISLSYSKGKNSEAPVDIVGTWTTTNPRYEDRALVFTDSTIAFFTGEGRSVTYSISGISVEESEYLYYYTIQYGSGDDESTIAFDYTDIPAPRIRLQNQRDMAWTRASDEAGATPDSSNTSQQ